MPVRKPPAARRTGGTIAAAEHVPVTSATAAKPRPPSAAAVKAVPKAGAKAPAGKPRGRARAPKPLEPALVREVFARLQALNPKPQGELEHVNPYTLLVAVVLSAQATDAGVNRATRPLFAIADTPEAMLAVGEDRVREAIKTIGLFRNKARNVIALSQALVERHGSRVPDSREALEALPGVGRKTANVVLNTAFGQPTIAVDTHLFRVSNRLPLAPGKTPLEVELGLERVVPDEFCLHAHHWLILHGRYICKALRPDCPRCPISDICRFEPKTLPVGAPPVGEFGEP